MNYTTALLIGCTLHIALLVGATPAQALNVRSFVSANGSDTNNCGRVTPCRTLQVAHDKTIASGEINMLDPAGYGTVTITKAISIVNDGVGSAGVLVPPGLTGITINAGVNDKINLRGLIIEGAGTGVTGIKFNSGKALTIGKSVIRNLSSSGIAFAPGASYPSGAKIDLAVTDTLIADNGGHGIFVQPIGNNISVGAVFNRVETYNNAQDGIGIYGNVAGTACRIIVSVDNSIAANNDIGFKAFTTAGAGSIDFTASRSTASHHTSANFLAQGIGTHMLVLHSNANGMNGTSFESRDNAKMFLSNSAAPTDNRWNVTNGALLITLGDNVVFAGTGPLNTEWPKQ